MRMIKDADGNMVPEKYLTPYDKARQKIVSRIRDRFEKMNRAMSALVSDSLKDIETLRELAGSNTEKGNFQIQSFDGNTMVELRQAYRIHLDDRVREAKQIMLDYAERLVGQVDGEDGAALLEIINRAFESRSDTLSVGKVMALLQYKINNPEWIKAREILIASIRPVKGKAYLHTLTRPDRQHNWTPIKTDLADCWPLLEDLEK